VARGYLVSKFQKVEGKISEAFGGSGDLVVEATRRIIAVDRGFLTPFPTAFFQLIETLKGDLVGNVIAPKVHRPFCLGLPESSSKVLSEMSIAPGLEGGVCQPGNWNVWATVGLPLSGPKAIGPRGIEQQFRGTAFRDIRQLNHVPLKLVPQAMPYRLDGFVAVGAGASGEVKPAREYICGTLESVGTETAEAGIGLQQRQDRLEAVPTPGGNDAKLASRRRERTQEGRDPFRPVERLTAGAVGTQFAPLW
jgi:hypothetical protein